MYDDGSHTLDITGPLMIITQKLQPSAYAMVALRQTKDLTKAQQYHAVSKLPSALDAICNNSGLGFTGYDKDGNANWDLISNINVLGFEFATNMRDAINNWNCGTNRWLRTIVYERAKEYGTVLTFALSAVWHGFYPGYYITFATGALMVTSARMARRMFRHRFQQTRMTRMLYDILTCLTTRSNGLYYIPICSAGICVEDRNFLAAANQASNNATSKDNLFKIIKHIPVTPKLPHVNPGREAVSVPHDQCEMDQLSSKLKEKIEAETKNIEEFIDKTVTETVSGIVEFKNDLMRGCEIPSGLRKRSSLLLL
ncbi:Membrane-bound O-acyltransferase domain-containing protein 2 [Eumeta japonica]|uniref:Membrane-bound O-acyltransferase domain-containing protein 2 n=1 Tax=Eumeta variegata TaxID=151549 RepID=A0A4C1TJX1_EUMVA|nr:Membrane-bound O-acyltransferase domain-containing protein 2 [Eumeta japonica]